MVWFVVVTQIAAVLVLVGATVSAWCGLRFTQSDQTFTCKLRSQHVSTFGGGRRWPWRCSEARWVHDVLVVQRGLLFPRVLIIPARIPEDTIQDADRDRILGLGIRPIAVSLRLDDGRLVEVAAARTDRTLLAGPFLAAAIPGLPQAPADRPKHGR